MWWSITKGTGPAAKSTANSMSPHHWPRLLVHWWVFTLLQRDTHREREIGRDSTLIVERERLWDRETERLDTCNNPRHGMTNRDTAGRLCVTAGVSDARSYNLPCVRTTSSPSPLHRHMNDIHIAWTPKPDMFFVVSKIDISLALQQARKRAFVGPFGCVFCVCTQVHMCACLFIRICMYV